MTIYLVRVHHDTHTCPADPTEPHPYITTRQLVGVIDGGPCRTPVTIRLAGRTVELPCGRHEPYDRQCGACRTIVTEQTVTATHHGHHQPTATRAAGGLAPRPCRSCHGPLAAVLTDLGQHIYPYSPPRLAA